MVTYKAISLTSHQKVRHQTNPVPQSDHFPLATLCTDLDAHWGSLPTIREERIRQSQLKMT